MTVTVIDQNGAASSEVRTLVQNLRSAQSLAAIIQDVNSNMDASQMLELYGLDPVNVPATAWVNNINALVTLLEDTTVQNFTGLLV